MSATPTKPVPTRSTPTTLVVCTTSHLDWDWITDFEQYYAVGLTSSDGGTEHNPVRYTFAQMFALFASEPTFRFSLAEMGYFRRYFADAPAAAALVRAAGPRLCLMGGGVVSPDNLVSHGEAFIRNYLLGADWLAALGLEASRDPLAWLPDDFGHDPQLPVVLAAMGFTAVAFSRVPGSPQPTPINQPLDGSPDVDHLLRDRHGLVFPWVAADGSTALAHFMPDTYSVDTSDLASFVSTFATDVWGGPHMFVPVPSNDFATPTPAIAQAVAAYNADPTDGVVAQLGTFGGFVDAVLADPSTLPPPYTLQASNYWTGFFASRPQLKLDHHAAVRDLLGAEALSVLLRLVAPLATSVLDALDDAVTTAWWSVARGTHHDFITGTSADQTYSLEQRPLAAQTRRLARGCRDQALDLLAESLPAGGAGAGALVVWNPLGFARTGVVAVDGVTADHGTATTPAGTVTVQRGADGALLFVLADAPALGYQGVTLVAGTPVVTPPPAFTDDLTLDNGAVTVTWTAASGWAITRLVDGTTGHDVIAVNGTANQLRWYTDAGNLYQFGNELAGTDGFSQDTVTVAAGAGRVVENGPVRWRFEV